MLLQYQKSYSDVPFLLWFYIIGKSNPHNIYPQFDFKKFLLELSVD